MTSFMDVLKAGGDVLKAVGALGLELAKEAGKGTVAVAKWAGNTALDVMATSSENSELRYQYDGSVGSSHHGCRRVLGQALVDLGLKRSRDSYLKDMLSRCAGIELTGPQGDINYAIAHNRSLCAKILQGDAESVQRIKKVLGNESITNEQIANAAQRIEKLFFKGDDYSNFVSEVFVVSVGENIEEFVYDENGETIRDANGNYVKKVVGTNYSVAVFKVTSSCGLKIKFKIHLNGGSWEDLKNHQHQYVYQSV